MIQYASIKEQPRLNKTSTTLATACIIVFRITNSFQVILFTMQVLQDDKSDGSPYIHY